MKLCYIGGYTNIFKPFNFKFKNGYVFDINSSYSYSMLFRMPLGKPLFIKVVDNLDKFFGFLKVSVIVDENVYIPMLPKRTNKGIIYPTGRFTVYIFSEELKFALKHNACKIEKIHFGYHFKKVEMIEQDAGRKELNTLFSKYVKRFYKLKSSAKSKSERYI